MAEYDFGGRVAVVTGAGRGIGRAYAQLLAARGAQVVVNDLGGTQEGDGSDAGPAQQVVDEIIAAGGRAVANGSDVSTPGGGAQIVDAALDAFGRIDSLVANAGIMRWMGLPEADAAYLQSHLDVHLLGSFNVIRAAWPHFTTQGYGRIVTTTSVGMFGVPENLAYASAKAGIIGLTRNAAIRGAEHGIRANVISPNAWTRMAGHPSTNRDDVPPAGDDSGPAAAMDPALVAPMVGLLAHERCPCTGEIFAAGAGRFSRIFIGATPGYLHTDGAPTIEDVAANLDTVVDEKGYTVPADLGDFVSAFMSHLRPAE
ncbi:SDR family NAD(P)-dependent oxidoreductase [Pseudonocardia parietis]|uniref:NAD(P)-dependent dehydrogenase (Short-subunit alcohol dehydrogenase family) n=1 Tax=Pseudonocardia parietis TaxID=570936 RepID=A0ABS4VY88_9PSEU|nr:SDR family NAD(P)-dependent oxidoreductase [Pseudonocardia parietis]MBP2368884.1 NAD(P)-dependent dehydrogenase (short-subunit alcohol dehydrogenase family) [Pseudonocardia parietis]